MPYWPFPTVHRIEADCHKTHWVIHCCPDHSWLLIDILLDHKIYERSISDLRNFNQKHKKGSLASAFHNQKFCYGGETIGKKTASYSQGCKEQQQKWEWKGGAGENTASKAVALPAANPVSIPSITRVPQSTDESDPKCRAKRNSWALPGMNQKQAKTINK